MNSEKVEKSWKSSYKDILKLELTNGSTAHVLYVKSGIPESWQPVVILCSEDEGVTWHEIRRWPFSRANPHSWHSDTPGTISEGFQELRSTSWSSLVSQYGLPLTYEDWEEEFYEQDD